MNYQNYLDKIYSVKIYELSEDNKNFQKKLLGSFASINALKSKTSINELSNFLINEIKDFSEIFIHCLKDTIKLYPEILKLSSKDVTEIYYRYIKSSIVENEIKLSDFLKSQNFPPKTFESSIRGYKININELLNINNKKIELFLNEQKTSKINESEQIKVSENKLEKSKDIWLEIEKEYGISKRAFGRKINFVTDKFRKSIIFRDIEQSFVLAKLGFSKPAVILSGSVIEELLRLYLEINNIKPDRDDFNSYIKACENNGLVKSAISRLSDSVRHFRNIVHLSKEESSRYTISIPTAKGAVSSIFTISNDF